MVERVPTLIEGLDDALAGGIPRRSVVLIAGAPGTMKSSFAFSILYHNVKEKGSKGLFVSLEQNYEELRGAMASLGMDGLDDMDLFILDVGRIRREHQDESGEKDWMQVLMEYIQKRMKAQDFDLIVIDPLPALFSLSEMARPRRDLFHFFAFLKELGPTSFLVSEIPFGSTRLGQHEEDHLADGILLLKQFEMGEREVQLRLRCVKLRLSDHDRGYFALIRENDRFMVTPVIAE